MKISVLTVSIAGLMLSMLMVNKVSLAATGLTQTQTETLQTLKQQALQDDLSYQLIESLTTEVGARLVGSEGEKRSVQWAVDKMKSLGFDKVWTEESEAQLWQRGDMRAQISSPFPHSVAALALGNSVGTNGKTLKAEVVEFADLAALKAASEDELEGKIAFISYKMERHKDGHGYGKAVGARVVGASEAAKKGAVAFIMRSVGTDSNKFAHTGVSRYTEGVKKIPAVAISNPDADLLQNALKRGKPVTFSLTTNASGPTGETTTIANVIGEVTGSKMPEQLVTLGAHLDSWDVGTGAIDDGIGVGITMAAGHYIATLKQRPARTLRVILFAAEEVGLLGAKDYVKQHKDEMSQHVIGAEWDFGNGKIYELEPGINPDALPAMSAFAKELASLGVTMADTNTAKGQSDMSALGEAGQPAVNFNPDGSDYFDFHHTRNDTLDKVDQEALKTNTAIYTMFAFFATSTPTEFRHSPSTNNSDSQ
ncbi:M20/M25/M40 family metallo-hydrolase [Alteromonas lipotrueiana]|uniref:M20/M25/M40 family metallo-hydrolase n=1 Tax=Alteromonas lipotrueiana TaxID=2803815 RepID=UPI001FECB307|nr:M20/M25/M40 family metallo-hydrolase [Alteromonas lipotrueiana]